MLTLPLCRGGPVSIPGGVRNFNSYPGIGCVPFVCVLSCDASGGGPGIVLTTHSRRPALVHLSSVPVYKQLLPYRHLTHGNLGCQSREGCKSKIGEGKY